MKSLCWTWSVPVFQTVFVLPFAHASLMTSVIRCSEFQNLNFKRPIAQFQYPILLVKQLRLNGVEWTFGRSQPDVFQSHPTLQNKLLKQINNVWIMLDQYVVLNGHWQGCLALDYGCVAKLWKLSSLKVESFCNLHSIQLPKRKSVW
jgi:hypothetical protein